MKIPILSTIFITLFTCTMHAQTATITSAQVSNNNVVITFNITGAAQGHTFAVELWYRANNEAYSKCRSVSAGSGDLSKMPAGNGLQLTWNVLADLSRLEAHSVDFELRITPNSAGNAYTETATGSASGIEMVFVQGGTFTMGCTSEQVSYCVDDEKPAHSVTVSNFYIGKYEVTQKQWRAVMGASATLSSPSNFKNCDECPVEEVSWNDIQEFLMKLNAKTGKTYRLPTEAEWEYAARGGSKSNGYKYSGSNDLGSVAWYTGNSNSKTHPVGQKSPNELGIYDMSGNVWEWCNDWQKGYPGSSGVTDLTGSFRVRRGGSWDSDAWYCRSACRYIYGPDGRSYGLGFRLAVVF